MVPAGTPGAFPDQPAEDPTEASKGTKGNLVEQAKKLGYTYVSNAAQLQAAGRKLLGLFANEEMFQQRAEGQGDVYTPVVDPSDHDQQGARHPRQEQAGLLPVRRGGGHRRVRATTTTARGCCRPWRSSTRPSPSPARTSPAPGHPARRHRRPRVRRPRGRGHRRPTDESGTGDSAEDGPFAIARQQPAVRHRLDDEAAHGRPVPVTAEGPGPRRSPGSTRTPTSTTCWPASSGSAPDSGGRCLLGGGPGTGYRHSRP